MDYQYWGLIALLLILAFEIGGVEFLGWIRTLFGEPFAIEVSPADHQRFMEVAEGQFERWKTLYARPFDRVATRLADHPKLDQNLYEQATAEFEALGFVLIGDFYNRHMESIVREGVSTGVDRILRSADGLVFVQMSQQFTDKGPRVHPNPHRRSTLPDSFMAVFLTTDLDDGTMLKTSNVKDVMRARLQNPWALGSQHAHSTPFGELLGRHLGDLQEHLSKCPGVRVRPVQSADDAAAFLKSEHEMGARRRVAIGWHRKEDVIRGLTRPVHTPAAAIAEMVERINQRELLGLKGSEHAAALALLKHRDLRRKAAIPLALGIGTRCRKELLEGLRSALGRRVPLRKLYATAPNVATVVEPGANPAIPERALVISKRQEGGKFSTFLTYYVWDAEATCAPARLHVCVQAMDSVGNVYVQVEFEQNTFPWRPGQRPTDEPVPQYGDFEGLSRKNPMPTAPDPPYVIKWDRSWKLPAQIYETTAEAPEKYLQFRPQEAW